MLFQNRYFKLVINVLWIQRFKYKINKRKDDET